jgi:tRNA threonylcarbamoyladenosine biosynthesis protein TsaE
LSTAIHARTASEADTEALARKLAEHLPSGTTIGLVGELGCGKTCFVRGLAAGLGVDPRDVASPTFLYLVDYAGGRNALKHADLYRFEGLTAAATEDGLRSIGLYDALATPGITAVEWWSRYVGPAPEQLVVVEFVIETADVRALTLTFSGAALEGAARALAHETTRSGT